MIPEKSANRMNFSSNLLHVCCLLCLFVLFARLYNSFFFLNSAFHTTSGLEEEALLSIWKGASGLKVYSNMFDIPFSASYFNWLFYWFYSSVFFCLSKVFDLEITALPATSRLTTLSLNFALLLLFLLLLQKILKTSHCEELQIGRPFEKISFGIIAILGPLFGYWSFTSRPDVGAIFFELLGTYFALISLRENKSKRISNFTILYALMASIFFYAAWSFKQIYISGILIFFIFMFFQRAYLLLFYSISISLMLYIATFWTHDSEYFYQLVLSQKSQGLHLNIGLINLAKAILKQPFIIPSVVISIIISFDKIFQNSSSKHNNKANDESLMFLCSLTLFSFFFSMVASAKSGASDNYFFQPAIYGSLLVGYILFNHNTQSIGISRPLFKMIGKMINVSIVFNIFILVLTILGIIGKLSPSSLESQQTMLELREMLTHTECPAIVLHNRFANLPWINPCEPNFVWATTYELDRSLHKNFKTNIGDLITNQYFKNIILPKEEEDSFDGVSLADSNYIISKVTSHFVFYKSLN